LLLALQLDKYDLKVSVWRHDLGLGISQNWLLPVNF